MNTVSLPLGDRRLSPFSKSVPNVARRAMWLAVAYVIVTGGLLAVLLMQLRSEAIVASKRELGAFAQLTAGHTFEVAAGLEDALKFTEATLSVAAGAADDDSIAAMLREVAANARGLKDILVLDAQGKVVYQATGRADVGQDWSDRPYFTQFKQAAALKFNLGAPFKRGIRAPAGEWLIPVAHSWRRSNGDFAGAIVGLMDRQFFDRAWTFESEIAGLSIALISAEGMPIMRRPFDDRMLGQSPVDRGTLAQLSGRDAATLEVRSPLDGEIRLVAYRRVAGYPGLLTLIAQPMDVVLEGWRRVAWIVGSSWLVASLVLGALGAWLAREMRARGAAEEQLRHSQKLDVLGQLTGGIAHDFNNILMVISGSAEALAEKNDIDAETRKGLDRISDSARRAEELTRQMLAFSRKQPLRARPTNVNDLVAGTGKLLRRTLGGQIEIESILADDVWNVDIDRAQLETSLVNLCLNARDAMPAGGRVLIETRNVSIDAAQAALLPGVSAGSFVQITVSDTGRGIPPTDIDRIFEPFFTTKASGKGSGLGLSMVYGFIKQSNGHISVTSEIDHGTIFQLLLPRFPGPIPEMTARSDTPAVGGSERILIVEDNPQVRAGVVRQAQSLGYAVTEAEDGAAGLAACEAAPRPYDLMLTDVIMPGGMNGKALADAVASRWPTTKIVFMSGYTDNVLGQGGENDDNVRLLSKPFRKSDLAQMIRQALDEK